MDSHKSESCRMAEYLFILFSLFFFLLMVKKTNSGDVGTMGQGFGFWAVPCVTACLVLRASRRLGGRRGFP